MAILVGIDEAGYGPLIGPLVVSSAVFRVPDQKIGSDLWHELKSAVVRGHAKDDGRIAIDDSKVLLRGRRTMAPLEEGALVFLRLAGRDCATLRGLTASRVPGASGEWDAYPWHHGRDAALPRAADPARIRRASGILADALAEASMEFLAAQTSALHATEYNALVKKWNNKAMTTAVTAMGMVKRFWEEYAEQGVSVHVDKLGGRNAYRSWLMAMCDGGRVETVEEGSSRSAYEIADGSRRMSVSFEPRADSRYLPVALASMFSKYLRELFMGLLNEFWTERYPGLKPTAGYSQDGRRFLSDLEARGGLDAETRRLLVRSR